MRSFHKQKSKKRNDGIFQYSTSIFDVNFIFSAWHKEFLDARNSRDGEKNQPEKNFVKHYSIDIER